ncbi:MAG: aldo/keto reductase [Rhizobiales bacterium]|nr:aldo/keto reductase [Hyphomicrobiales bacterium]NRB13647.1 aldo/keto reductase [Hyphomicrobiales bacterium]
MTNMQYRPLGNTGLNVSTIGYGASPLGSMFRDVKQSVGIETVHKAIEYGINLFDVSPHYGDTIAEQVLGHALADIDRSKYYVSTKCGRYADHGFDFSADRINRSLDESCKRLGLDYIDIFYLHDIEYADPSQILNESLPAIMKLKEQGRIGNVGITGYPLEIFKAIVGNFPIDAIITYCRYALHDQSLLSILPYLVKHNIGIINASATGMGLLTKRGVPSWHPANQKLRELCANIVEQTAADGFDITKLAIQFSTQHPAIASTLIGTANPVNLKQNIDWHLRALDSQKGATQQCEKIISKFNQVETSWPSAQPEKWAAIK